MYIKKIRLFNFRNYIEQEIFLNENINIFYGDNAQGKTNILEAIYMCALGRSFRTRKEKETVNIEKERAIIEVFYEKNNREQKIKIEIDDKKNIFINDIKVKKISEILGNINVVMFCPDDIEILKGNPEKRRKFLDIMIGQLKPIYIYNLSQYIKVLQQRNNYLRQIKYENKPIEILEIWDEQLFNLSKKIYSYRSLFIEKINNNINNIHEKITNNNEKIEIKYITNFNENNYKSNLKKFLKNDIQKGYTNYGIHRDDFKLFINNRPINIYGSQGQFRSAILSLKLTELNIINDEIGESPILLLDDFMSELDNKRKNNFLDNINNLQVLITCTEKINKENSKIFYIEKGKVKLE